MIRRKTWRSRMTTDAINRKVNRRKNPVTTYTQLANEFGAPVYPNRQGTGGPAPSSSFRTIVQERVGNIFA